MAVRDYAAFYPRAVLGPSDWSFPPYTALQEKILIYQQLNMSVHWETRTTLYIM